MNNDTYNYTNDLLDANPRDITYAGFGERFGASMIDSLILSAFVLPLTYFNFTGWKSPLVLVIVSILSVVYKPFMEFQFGATIGKKALKIQIVNYAHEKASLTEILLRNSILITISVCSMLLSLSLFSMAGFEEVDTYMEYVTFVSQNRSMSWVTWFTYFYYFVDLITFFAGDKKRTLHDIIGKTYAIKVVD